jgi:hypothetical protein
MSMPETSMYEDGNLKTRQHYVRLADQFLYMKAISKSLREKPFPDVNFRRRVSASHG